MKQRGRKSAVALATPAAATVIMSRPEAPLELTPEETDVWNRTVDAMPASWFPAETWPLLTQYCRHVITSRRVAQLIDAEMSRPHVDVDAVKRLLGMQAKETAAIKAMSAAMRLSQQSGYSARGAAGERDRRPMVERPWE